MSLEFMHYDYRAWIAAFSYLGLSVPSVKKAW